MYVVLTNNIVTALSEIPQPGIPGFVQVADDDARVLAFLAPTPEQIAAGLLAPKIAAGIALTSTGTSSLNATYALDDVSTAQIYQIGLYAAQFGVFPSGASTQAYPDATGTQHTFNVTQFVAFLRAVAPLVSSLQTQAQVGGHGGTPTWPSQAVTIA